MKIVVVGGGIFGVTAALELRRRGHDATLLDPGPLPHPLAESTDISKAVRMDYGADVTYTRLMEEALDGWRRWNARWETPLFHEDGVMFVTRAPMSPGGFEHDSYVTLTSRGHRLERMDTETIRRRFPAWNAELYVDGYRNPAGGWAESGRVVARLLREAADVGVVVRGSARVARVVARGRRVSGIELDDGAFVPGEQVVVAAGGWTLSILPHLSSLLRTVAQPVFHLAPADVAPFSPACFPTFGADIAVTGYYGFPAHGGVVKIANHGPGRPMHPGDVGARAVTAGESSALASFVAGTFPSLVGAPVVATRICVYCDTTDEHFLLDRDPSCDGIVVATGGSGHAFKFAPVLGALIADRVEGKDLPFEGKFAFRPDRGARGEEAARGR